MKNTAVSPTHSAWIAGGSSALLWASAFPAIRIAAPNLGVFGLTTSRLIIASVTLLIVGTVTRKIRLPQLADLPRIFACGICGMAGYFLLLNWGELFVPAGTASMIVSASPIISIIIACIFLGESLTKSTIIGSVIAIAGVSVVCLSRSGIDLSSAVWIIVAASTLLGIYHPLAKPLLKKYTGLEVATYATVSASLLTLPFLPIAWPHLISAPTESWAAALYLGVFPSAFGYALWGFALARLSTATSTSLLYFVPVIAVVIGYLWLNEVPLLTEILGGSLAVIGVVFMNAFRTPREPSTQNRKVRQT
ncbi:DMT family transporter [Glutamicibacter uratoxydans]|nr:DMT family transporter [Glutamicibacter uratoxydans]